MRIIFLGESQENHGCVKQKQEHIYIYIKLQTQKSTTTKKT